MSAGVQAEKEDARGVGCEGLLAIRNSRQGGEIAG
jgi:hypothetical protein